jgi:hypothetical protein
MLIKSVKHLSKLREGLDRLGIHILWRKYVLKRCTYKYDEGRGRIYKHLFFGSGVCALIQ